MNDQDPQGDDQNVGDSQEERIAQVIETGQKAGSTKQALKEAKLKKALRSNLQRRKAKARALRDG